MNNWDYPIGADCDDAPWNRMSPYDEFHDKANEQLRDSVKNRDCDFLSFAFENYSEFFLVCSFHKVTKEAYDALPTNVKQMIETAYVDEMEDSVIDELWKDKYDN